MRPSLVLAVHPQTAMIRSTLLVAASFIVALPVWNQEAQPNVNSRYVIESVNVLGSRVSRLSDSTRQELESFVGQKLDHSLLDRFASEIRRELRVDKVAIHVSRGTEPEHVKVEFTVENQHRRDFDISFPKGLYQSKQGWSGAVDTTTSFGKNDVSAGVISDGDTLVERFSGLRTRYERNALGTPRLRFRFEFDSYHEQWNSSTLETVSRQTSPYSLYRSRQNFEPSITIVLAEPLTLTVGVSVERLEPQATAVRIDSSNSVINTLRYHRAWEDGESNKHSLDAGYSLRAATSFLGSDFGYTRHAANVKYSFTHDRNTLTAEFLAGRINGNAPLFDRFVLGNGSTLRGWNKFDLDPLGGDRMIHGSVDYGYRIVQVFFDTGAIWDQRTQPEMKQSVGIGVGRRGKEGFLIALAFPLRSGHVDPVLLAGFNF
jgi:outer membrane protein assembly factor BamA